MNSHNYYTLVLSVIAILFSYSILQGTPQIMPEGQQTTEQQFQEASEYPIITVIDKELDYPLAGVIVYNSSKSFTGATNNNGQIEIKDVALTDSLYFQYAGYKEQALSLQQIQDNNNLVYLFTASVRLDEFVVTAASKFAERTEDIPSKVEVIDSKDIALNNPQTSADMLGNTGKIFIQKSQMGGGSPIVRGFEANKLLLVIDGVRMNNAIYRSGHLQNVLSVDPWILERTEVIFGPVSVLYGSDALGGVIHFLTKAPKLYDVDEKKNWELNAGTRFSTSNLEKSGHIDFNYGTNKWASFTSITTTDFDDLRSGSVKGKNLPPDFGDRLFYPDRENAKDSVYTNNNPRIQLGTGYTSFDLLQKIRFQPSDSISFLFNGQYSTTSAVPRYDQLTEGQLDTLDGIPTKEFKFSDWDYGPQQRLMLALSSDIKNKNLFFNHAKLLATYQKIDEDRITRRFNVFWRNVQQENVHVFAFNADLSKDIFPNRLKLMYGTEFSYNNVISRAFQRNIVDADEAKSLTRYPDGGSHMLSVAGYLMAHVKLNDKVKVIGGLRQTYISLTANYVDTSFFNLPYSRAFLSTTATTGSVGLTWKPAEGYNIKAIAYNAFRAPNVDDFGKIRSKGGFVRLPNPNLVAEKTLNAELSFSKNFDEKVKVSGTYFYSYLFDALVAKQDTLEDGAPVFFYDGAFDTIQRNFNAGEGFIYGISGDIIIKILPNLEFESILNYTLGHNISDDAPLSHIPPIYGNTRLTYSYKDKATFQFVANYNGWKRKKRYDLIGSSDNFDKATEEGTPPWYTLNIRATYNIKKRYDITASIENILDRHYRPFSSGISASGINFSLSLRGRF